MATREEALALQAAGLSQREAAAKLGCSRTWYRKLVDAGLAEVEEDSSISADPKTTGAPSSNGSGKVHSGGVAISETQNVEAASLEPSPGSGEWFKLSELRLAKAALASDNRAGAAVHLDRARAIGASEAELAAVLEPDLPSELVIKTEVATEPETSRTSAPRVVRTVMVPGIGPVEARKVVAVVIVLTGVLVLIVSTRQTRARSQGAEAVLSTVDASCEPGSEELEQIVETEVQAALAGVGA